MTCGGADVAASWPTGVEDVNQRCEVGGDEILMKLRLCGK